MMYEHEESLRLSSAAAQELSDRVMRAGKSTQLGNEERIKSSSLAQLRLSNMRLHGREEEMKLLQLKLQELRKGVSVGQRMKVLPELVLVSGVSG